MLWFCSCCCRLFYQYPTCQNQVVLTSSSRLCCQFLSCFFFVRSFVCSTTYVLLEHTTLCCLFAPAIFRPFVAKAAIFRTLARRSLGVLRRKKIILTSSQKLFYLFFTSHQRSQYFNLCNERSGDEGCKQTTKSRLLKEDIFSKNKKGALNLKRT